MKEYNLEDTNTRVKFLLVRFSDKDMMDRIFKPKNISIFLFL